MAEVAERLSDIASYNQSGDDRYSGFSPLSGQDYDPFKPGVLGVLDEVSIFLHQPQRTFVAPASGTHVTVFEGKRIEEIKRMLRLALKRFEWLSAPRHIRAPYIGASEPHRALSGVLRKMLLGGDSLTFDTAGEFTEAMLDALVLAGFRVVPDTAEAGGKIPATTDRIKTT